MQSHVAETVSACFAVLWQLCSIQRSVPRPILQSLCHLFFCCCWTMATQPSPASHHIYSSDSSHKLIIMQLHGWCPVHQSSTMSLFCQLHSLKASERIEFKLAVLVYKCLHGTALSYLTDKLHQPEDFAFQARGYNADVRTCKMHFAE